MKATYLTLLGLLYLGTAHTARASEQSAIANIMLKHLNLIDGDVENTGSSKTCKALRGKIAQGRDALKKGPDWMGVQQLPQYGTLAQSRSDLEQAKCTPRESEKCRELRTKLRQDAEGLAKTKQWDQFARSNDWRSLRERYAEAEKLDCVRAPTPHLQTPDGSGS